LTAVGVFTPCQSPCIGVQSKGCHILAHNCMDLPGWVTDVERFGMRAKPCPGTIAVAFSGIQCNSRVLCSDPYNFNAL
jgi:hypothetical protein